MTITSTLFETLMNVPCNRYIIHRFNPVVTYCIRGLSAVEQVASYTCGLAVIIYILRPEDDPMLEPLTTSAKL